MFAYMLRLGYLDVTNWIGHHAILFLRIDTALVRDNKINASLYIVVRYKIIQSWIKLLVIEIEIN